MGECLDGRCDERKRVREANGSSDASSCRMMSTCRRDPLKRNSWPRPPLAHGTHAYCAGGRQTRIEKKGVEKR
eukprot:5676810-Pleurochrysis_carterae.AAC.2